MLETNIWLLVKYGSNIFIIIIATLENWNLNKLKTIGDMQQSKLKLYKCTKKKMIIIMLHSNNKWILNKQLEFENDKMLKTAALTRDVH